MKKHLNWKTLLAGLSVLLITAGIFLDAHSKSKAPAVPPQEPISLDQLAPKGFSLFPISPINHEALSNVMGAMGTVAIYDGDSSQLIVDGLRLVRSRENPDTFLALVPDQKMSQMIQVASRIVAVLKNPTATDGTNFVRKNNSSNRTVFYGRDSL